MSYIIYRFQSCLFLQVRNSYKAVYILLIKRFINCNHTGIREGQIPVRMPSTCQVLVHLFFLTESICSFKNLSVSSCSNKSYDFPKKSLSHDLKP